VADVAPAARDGEGGRRPNSIGPLAAPRYNGEARKLGDGLGFHRRLQVRLHDEPPPADHEREPESRRVMQDQCVKLPVNIGTDIKIFGS
jgi:hypothetical protein